jgi:hypothetical protein
VATWRYFSEQFDMLHHILKNLHDNVYVFKIHDLEPKNQTEKETLE